MPDPGNYEVSVSRRVADAKVMFDLLATLRNSPLKPSDRVIDIGCGPVSITQSMWSDKSLNHLTGIDINDYSSDMFWKSENRSFIQGDFLDHTFTESQCNIAWSCFSAHHITGGEENSSKVSVFFSNVASLLTDDGFFLCQVPACPNFFPYLYKMGESVLQDTDHKYFTNYQKSRLQRYRIWNDGDIKHADNNGLKKLYDLRMYTWRPATRDVLFETWWSANISIIQDLGISKNKEQLKSTWCARHLTNPETVSSYLISRILIFKKSSSDNVFRHSQTKSDGLPLALVMDCLETMREDVGRDRPVSDTFQLQYSHDNENALSVFKEHNEPVLGKFVLHQSIRDFVLYVTDIRYEQKGGRWKPARLVFDNVMYHKHASIRENLLNVINTSGKFTAIAPNIKKIQGSKSLAVCSWFTKDANCLGKEIMEFVDQKEIIHLFCQGDNDYVDDHVEDCLNGSLVLIMNNYVKLEDLFGRDEEYSTAVYIQRYFNWYLLSYQPQLSLIVDVTDIGKKKEVHSLVLSLALNQLYDLTQPDIDKLVIALNFSALQLKQQGKWTTDSSVNKVLSFYEKPYINSEWPSCWEHGRRNDTKGIDGNYDAITNSLTENIWGIISEDRTVLNKSIKGLFMVSPGGRFVSKTLCTSKVVSKAILEKILKVLGFDSITMTYNLHNNNFYMPIIPGIMFIIPLKLFVGECESEDPPVNICSFEWISMPPKNGLCTGKIIMTLEKNIAEAIVNKMHKSTEETTGLAKSLKEICHARTIFTDSNNLLKLFRDGCSDPICEATGVDNILTLSWTLTGGA